MRHIRRQIGLLVSNVFGNIALGTIIQIDFIYHLYLSLIGNVKWREISNAKQNGLQN